MEAEKKDEKQTQNPNQKEDVLAKDKKELTPEQANKEKLTIMPTMIDESEEIEIKRRDLSSIIPKATPPTLEPNPSDNSVELVSRENILKSDGAITLANLDENGEAVVKANFTYPDQIDIEKRKEEKTKNVKKKKVKIKPSAAAQRFQNRSALMALIVIILLGAFYWYEKNKPTEEDFMPLTVTIEAGESLPLRGSDYVKPGVGTVDELLYQIDKSQIIIDKVGEYPFTVTYKGITKTGTVIIKDSTKPLLVVKEVLIVEGENFEAASFVDSCIDWSGCNYSFANSTVKQEYTEPGSYNVTIIATDAYQNSEFKTASLIIEPKGNLKTYYKDSGYNFETGYSVSETYLIRYFERDGESTLITGKYTQIFTYQDEEIYKKARETYNGEVNYTCDDSNYTITHVKSVSTIGSNYSNKRDIESYLSNNGFREKAQN